MTGVILAAGRGMRMGCLTRSRPKPLLAIGGTPLLCRTVFLLTKIGLKRIVCVVGYQRALVIAYLEALREKEAWLSGTELLISISDAWENDARRPFDYLDSLSTAKELVGSSDFCVIHPDEVFADLTEINAARKEFCKRRPLALIVVKSIRQRHFIRVRLEPAAENVGKIVEYLPGYPEALLPAQLGITFCDNSYWHYVEEARTTREFAPDLALRDKRLLLAFHYGGEWWQFNTARDIERYREHSHRRDSPG
jgi:NDP-sugar pyrophosphorylase family protein